MPKVTDRIARVANVQVRVKVVYSGIGPVTQSDVQLAAAADASILAFNVRAAGPAVEAEAKQSAVTTCAQVPVASPGVVAACTGCRVLS